MKNIMSLLRDPKSVTAIIYLLLIILFLFPKTAKIVHNEHMVNKTVDGVSSNVPELYYSNIALVPVKAVGENNTNVFQVQDLLVVIIGTLIFLVILFIQREGRLLTMEEVKTICRDSLKKRTDINSFKIMEQAYLIEEQIDDGTKIFSSWILNYTAELSDKMGELGGNHIYAEAYDPYTGFKKNTYELKEMPAGLRPRCEICGNFPDKKIITPEGYKAMLDKMGLKATSKA